MNTLAKYCVMNKLDSRFISAGSFRRIVSEMSTSSETKAEEEEIKIPDRIERSTTDILKALASTVGTDYTAPHYRYHDDPWLIPYTNYEKRNFWLAKESGRNAARFIAERHPHLFDKNRIHAEPPITAFQPRVNLNIDNVTPELLENYISNLQVEDAITVYNLLKEKKKRISNETEQALLELLAYNAEEEEITLENKTTKSIFFTNTKWVTGGLAEQLYSRLQTPEARLAMLLGTAKYNQFSRTAQLWEEMEANGDVVPVEGYNAIISTLGSNDLEHLKGDIVAYLNKMKSSDVFPDHNTLASCLFALARFCAKAKRSTGPCNEFALSLLAEFKSIGIEPSPGSYAYLLDIFYKGARGERPMILCDILDALETKQNLWPAKTLPDFNFFHRAMEVAKYLTQVKLAYRIHGLLHTGDNANLLSNFQSNNKYHYSFFITVLRSEPFDVAMSLYDKLVPNTWSPSSDVFTDILLAMSSKSAVQYIGKLFDDMELLQWGEANKETQYEINTTVLKIIDNNISATSEFSNLGETYADIAHRVFKHLVDNKMKPGLYLRFNTHAAGLCSLAIKILLTEGQFEKCKEVFNFCNEEKDKIPGQLNDEVLVQLVEEAVHQEQAQFGLQIVDYLLSINSSKARVCGLKLATLKLSHDHSETLNKYFAQDQKWTNI
jgi:pentatricopeptide repeat domain-containing protein 3